MRMRGLGLETNQANDRRSFSQIKKKPKIHGDLNKCQKACINYLYNNPEATTWLAPHCTRIPPNHSYTLKDGRGKHSSYKPAAMKPGEVGEGGSGEAILVTLPQTPPPRSLASIAIK